jgi:hypothetical protein
MEDENNQLQRELDKLKLEAARLDDFNLALYRVYAEAKRLRNMKDRPSELDKLMQTVYSVEHFIKGE